MAMGILRPFCFAHCFIAIVSFYPIRFLNMTTVDSIMRISSPEYDPGLDVLLETQFERQTCLEIVTSSNAYFSGVRHQYLWFGSRHEGYSAFITNGSSGQYSLCPVGNDTNAAAEGCIISDDRKCDGFSVCPGDECGCGLDAFRCADGGGCIAPNQICDGRGDCQDFSDECTCHDYQQCTRDILHLPRPDFCHLTPNCTGVTERFLDKDVHRKLINNNRVEFSDSYPFNWTYVEICAQKKHYYGIHCDRLKKRPGQVIYECSNDSEVEAASKMFDVDDYNLMFCNGIRNCRSGIDEQDCPNMFYCDSDGTPLLKDRVCDSISDCLDSSDECSNCSMTSYLTSNTHLISSNLMLAILVFQIACIIILNLYALQYHTSRLSHDQNIASRIDVIQCITLIFYDMMTASYLIIMCVKHIEYWGVYCSRDLTWRSSYLCKIAGALSYGASHGALQVAVATSVCRAYTCLSSIGKEISISSFSIFFSLLNTFNFGMAVVPLLATFKPSHWTDVFVHKYSFKNNPFIRQGTKDDMAKLIDMYKRQNSNVTVTDSASEMLSKLRNLTEKGELFGPDHITSVGLYGTTSLCYPDLFSAEPALLIYKVIYMVEITIYLAVIIVCYILITRKFFKSRSAVAQVPGKRQGQVPDNKAFFLSFKVTIVIATQLICWLPVQVAIISSFVGVVPSSFLTDILVINIKPFSGILNPILHSDLLSKAFPFVAEKIEALYTRFQPNSNEVEMVVKENNDKRLD